MGQWGREEEQIGAIKGCEYCEYPSICQSDEQRYGGMAGWRERCGKGTGLYQSLPISTNKPLHDYVINVINSMIA